MKLEITKDHQSGNRKFKKGQVYDVPKKMLKWKADELVNDNAAKYINAPLEQKKVTK